MKKVAIIIIAIFLFSGIKAQIFESVNPTQWTYTYKKMDNKEIELIIKGQIVEDWHLYGQYFDEGGPIPLKITFEKNDNYELVGRTEESPKPVIEKDEIFNIQVSYFKRYVFFVQRVKLKDPSQPINIKMTMEGQACKESDGMCVMVSDEHTFKIK